MPVCSPCPCCPLLSSSSIINLGLPHRASQATLNARASILAAANPVGGRYDKAKPFKYNVALPPAILSRWVRVHPCFLDLPTICGVHRTPQTLGGQHMVVITMLSQAWRCWKGF